MYLVLLEDNMDLLGVTADSKLKLNTHVAKICCKVSQQVAVLNRMEKILPSEIHMKLYQAFIFPDFNNFLLH